MCRVRFLFVTLVLAALAGLSPHWTAAPADKADESPEEARERAVMQRFLTVLEKNPRRGTALDRVYGFHVERGTLDKLVKTYTDRTKKDPKDGQAWMVLGLLEAQRGKDAAAVAALRQAEKHRADDALASYYLGQALVLIGQPDAAAEAFEHAIGRKPNPADLLDIFQALGRVYQRSQRNEQALAVWARLEQIFPDDLRVQEQIAGTLAEEGQHEQALKRYEALARKTKDRYRQALFRMEAAELKVRLGKSPAALADFEQLFSQLNPDSWLYREVRRKIEEVFLRNDDLAGLAKYYEGWVAKNAEDLDAMARLARVLAMQGRVPEAQTWLARALKLAPSRKELRLTFIEQLVIDQKYDEAAKQYQELLKNDPNNPDYLRETGRLILKDKARPEAERKKAAADVWRNLLTARPKDPVVITQVADLFRQAELTDEALALYKKAIELAPDSAQYREYLGEYYHSLKRSAEALATWKEIAAGKNRNAKNLNRLAEVLAGFGYLKEATEAIAEACKLDAEDFNLRFKHADLLHQTERYDDALKELAAAEKLASNVEEAEAVLEQQIKNFQATETLPQRTDALRNELKADAKASADRWYLLARYLEAGRQTAEATAAIRQAVAAPPGPPVGKNKESNTIRIWTAAARIHEAGGNLLEAANANRKLAAIDRRYRTEYLTNVAKLEAKLGRKEQALQAGRDLIAAAPNNPEHYQFFSSLCFQLGQEDDGFDSLRRSVRVNPEDPKVIINLAGALAERFRTDEAIELYWRAFEKTKELEGKLTVISHLAELYLRNNHFERLTERLERERREEGKQREFTICLAQAYQSAGDHGTARQQLERLLAENARDSQLLHQLSALAESEGDLGTASKYQQQLTRVSPGRDNELRLAQLLTKAGELDEAGSLWVRLITSEPDPHRLIQSIDSLMTNAKYDTVQAVTERLLRDQPHNWEALYRQGVALASLEKPAEAVRRFRELLAVNAPDDDQSVLVKARKKNQLLGRTAHNSRTQPVVPETFPLQDRVNASWQVRVASKLEPRQNYGGQPNFWSPADFGQARMAALGWLFTLSRTPGQQGEFMKAQRAALTKTGANQRAWWDWLYLNQIRQEQREVYEAAKQLAQTNADAAATWMYLSSLSGRTAGKGPRVVRPSGPNVVDNTPPLPKEELEYVLKSYRTLQIRRPEWAAGVIGNVAVELKRAKRTDEETKLYRDAIAAAEQPAAINDALGLAAQRGDVDGVLGLFDKLEQHRGKRHNPYNYQDTSMLLAQVMKHRADAKAFPDILRIWDHYLAAIVQRKKNTPPSSRTSNYGNPYGGQNYYQIWSGQYYRGVQVDYPTPNEYYDYQAVQLLRNAFEFYRQADLVSDLIKHTRGRLQAASEADQRVFHLLGLAYLNWWNDDKDAAIDHLTQAVNAVPADTNLRFELVDIREKRNEFEDALTVLDALTPTDHSTMQKRETAALRLAVRTGNIERARQAAERLFGLRLDAETQVALAAQMRQLGMHDLAEAVLARAGRQAGNRVAAQVSLMLQYQSQGKGDVAVQIAHQLLRHGPAQFSPYGGQNQHDSAREQALQVLARSGKLETLIERTEAQLKNSPNSIRLNQILADYYRAAGNRDKTREVYERMAKLRPDDARLRYQIAQRLIEAGELPAAIGHYSAAIKKDPSLFANNYWQIEQYYRQANKLDELMEIFESVDVRQLGNYWQVMNAVSQLLQDQKARDRGLKLFRKAWQAFPEQRPELLGYVYNEEIWRLPEMYNYARDAVLPPEGETQLNAWNAVNQVVFYNGDGKVVGVVTRLLEAASRQNKLDALTADVEKTLKRFPDWDGGKAILAMLCARRGQIDRAKQLLEGVIDNPKSPMPLYARWIVGQDLEDFGPLQPIALRLYEAGMKDSDVTQMEYQWNPARRLVTLYQRMGRMEDARSLALKFTKHDESRYSWDPSYGAYQTVMNLSAIGQQMLDLGYPVDAIRLFNDILSDENRLQQMRRWYGGDHMKNQAQQGLTRALQSLKPETLPAALRELLRPRAAKAGGPVVDLAVLVQPRDLTRAELTSVLARTLRAVAGYQELRKDMRATMADLLGKHPAELSLHIADALVAFTEKDAAHQAEAVRKLVALVEKTALEPLPPGARANSRQRDEAMPLVALWLVARECEKDTKLRAAGAKLAERALEAARRQADSYFALAILREWGQLALDRGDRATAEARWTRMLELVLPPAAKPTPSPRAAADGLVLTTIALAPGDAAPKRKPARSLPVVTLERFDQAADIAKLAAQHGMNDLSLRAVREALRAGPPIHVNVPNTNQQGMIMAPPAAGGGDQAERSVFQRVEQKLEELSGLWRRKKFPAAAVYETLAGAVLPELRPEEIFLYPFPLAHNVRRPRSASRLLADWSVSAGQTSQLRRQVEARQKEKLAELNAHVLLGQLGLAGNDAKLLAEHIEWLSQRLQKDTLQNTSELVCHVALPALHREATSKQALPMLERAAKHLQGAGDEPVGGVMVALARFHFERHNAAEGRKQLLEYKSLLMRSALRGGGWAQVQQFQKIAAEFARAGLFEDILDLFGQYADMAPTIRQYYGNSGPSVGALAASFARQLAAVPAAKRYEMFKTWALPTLFRKSARNVATFAPSDPPPAVFGKLPPRDGELINSASLMIDAARDAGKLDDLEATLKKLADQKVENGQLLYLLTKLARGQAADVEPQFKQLLAQQRKEIPRQGEHSKPVEWSDYLLARACLENDRLRPLGEEWARLIVTHAQRTQNSAMLAHVRRMLNQSIAARQKATGIGPDRDPGFALWHPTGHYTGGIHAAGAAPSWWVSSGGYVSHLCGPNNDFLYFDYPVSGTFEFSVDALDDGWAEGHVQYGGLVFEPHIPGIGSSMWRVGRAETIKRDSRFNHRGGYDRLTVQVRPGVVRYLVNGHLFFEDKEPSPTSPWLALFAASNRQPVWKHFTLTGTPEIPREVRLSHADRLEGWVSGFYNESVWVRPRQLQPPAAKPGEPAAEPAEPPNPDDFDWTAQNGVIVGRRTEQTPQPEAIQSRLYYHRPLRNGETISYEFLYEPDAVHTHPALGRLVFLLDPEGVRLHWMTDGPDNEWTGLKTDNIAEEPANRRGPSRLPLKPGEWNQLKLSVVGDKVTLALNGTTVYERPLEPENERLFSFFHYKDRTAVQVRNVLLTGDWPKNLTAQQLANLTAPADTHRPAADRRAQALIIGEPVFHWDVDHVLRHARNLAPAERYAYLLDWVLPNEEHTAYRLYATYSPTDPAPAATKAQGGVLQAPALELMDVAKELGKLDELAARVEKAPVTDYLSRRSKRALQTLVALAQGRGEAAAAGLKETKAMLAKISPQAALSARWPELLVAARAAARPESLPQALDLLNVMVEQVQQAGVRNINYPYRPEWERFVRNERARAQVLALPDSQRTPFGSAPKLAYWSPATRARADTRGPGHPPMHWRTGNGELFHYPGHAHDYLYFALPLSGNFEVECELTSFGWREAQLHYAGMHGLLVYDLKRFNLEQSNRMIRQITLNPPVPKVGDWYKYRLEIKDGMYRCYVGDRMICEERLPAEPDPWLAVHALNTLTGGARNVRIKGTPTIPEVVRLSHLPDLTGWLADYYGDSVEWGNAGLFNPQKTENNAAWGKRGEEIVGRVFTDLPGSKQESILRYHRPLFEDGELEYEFFYEKGKTLAHPALDRLVFLLAEDGVKVHWLTDGQYDRTGLAPDNIFDEPANRKQPRVPLQSPGWNRASLKLAGDTVTLSVNGTPVYERKLEAGNQRIFGLFHYADETEVRVRNVKHRGNWPKKLPAAAAMLAPKAGEGK